MALANYSDLKTAIADWMHRDDLTSYLDDFIDLTEAWFASPPRRPDDPEIGGLRVEITEDTDTLTAGQAYIAKPSTYLSAIRFDLTGTDGGRVEYIAPDGMPFRFLEGTGRPRFWTVTDVIEFNVAPDAAYAYSLKYWSNPGALSVSNTTNTVITNYPNIYLAGCLHHACEYIQDAEGAAKWLARYKQAAWNASKGFKAETITSGDLAAQVA